MSLKVSLKHTELKKKESFIWKQAAQEPGPENIPVA